MPKIKIDEIKNIISLKYPKNLKGESLGEEKDNSAIRLYGRRYYKDQTPVEYLAELFLVFSSPKKNNGDFSYEFNLNCSGDEFPCYYPEDKIATKLFSFFPISKLETRHPIHNKAYIQALDFIGNKITGSKEDQQETISIIQSLFGGFVGVAKNRTWVTYSFLPMSSVFLARELNWLHSKANKNSSINEWSDAEKYFAHDRHNFMARGGELLFLQLSNLFSNIESENLLELLKRPEYFHLKDQVRNSEKNITTKFTDILLDAGSPLSSIANFVDGALVELKINKDESSKISVNKKAMLGWVPASTNIEAMLFAIEIDNICCSRIGTMDKLELLQILCCMQVLRSLCFQARRIDYSEKETIGFVGNYAWIFSDNEAKIGAPTRKISEASFNYIEALLYRVLRNKLVVGSGSKVEADKHGFQIFRKIAKEIGMVIPLNGSGQRFSLHQGLLRFLVAAVIRPNERIRLTTFYQRVFAHYGIALGGEQLTVALAWNGTETDDSSYAASSSTAWVEEALQQGGFLVELSDAVSMVKNPG
ncbi:MAG: hypothetical protein H7240_02755 [Glaciimonas sp.]|nr:hypothetical protein [Glaciimonas sp.]